MKQYFVLALIATVQFSNNAMAAKSSVTCVVFDSKKSQEVYKYEDALMKVGPQLIFDASNVKDSVRVSSNIQKNFQTLEIKVWPELSSFVTKITYDLNSGQFAFGYGSETADTEVFNLACGLSCKHDSKVVNAVYNEFEQLEKVGNITKNSFLIDNSRFQGSVNRSQSNLEVELDQYITGRKTKITVTNGRETKIQVLSQLGKDFKGIACHVK